MAASAFEQAINQIVEEKGIPKETIISTIEAALSAAFRKDFGQKDQRVEVEFDPRTGTSTVYDVKEVVDVMPEETEGKGYILLDEAKTLNEDAEVGDVIRQEVTPTGEYGRIAAQTAKQVIVQRLREAERELLLAEFQGKEGSLMNGTVQRVERGNVYVELGHAIAVMYPADQVRAERYTLGQRLKVYIVEVRQTPRGPEIIVSRSHPQMVKKLFELEVPEIFNNTVQVKGIAREAGSRTKFAVFSDAEGVDPVGSCVGQRGTRVQTVISELNGEKIDIILWDANIGQFIANALSPAKVSNITLNETERRAIVEVPEDQMSLAIGREGQNVRLCAKLTGWRVDVVKTGESASTETPEAAAGSSDAAVTESVPETAADKVSEKSEAVPVETPNEEQETPTQQ